jgi:hypothetical protein
VEYEYHYAKFPKLAAYIDRIEAEQINFRRFVVKERDTKSGYPRYKARIKIKDDLSVSCSDAACAPTEAEVTEIAAELAKVEFPRSVEASRAEVEELKNSGQIKGDLYVFHDLSREHVVMCQERRETSDGKIYLPWTLFAAKGKAAVWRQMEPDGDALPFWKPVKKSDLANVMVHEGAKAAAFVDGLINDWERREERKTHPWAEELARFEHWGAIGGASRNDFAELRARNVPGDVVYVCDHDAPGEEALRAFSMSWGGELQAIRFDERFGPGWDLANAIPNSLRNEHGRVDLRLDDLIEPATWATRVVKQGGRSVYDLTDHFAREWVHVIEPAVFINRRFPERLYREKHFDHFAASYAHHRVVVSELLRLRPHGRVDTIRYRPHEKTGVHTSERKTHFNTYRPPIFEPYGGRDRPDLSPLEDFLERLFVVAKERHEAKRWLATLIAIPEVRMRYGLLLVSEVQGVGKTTLCKMASGAIGNHNVCYATAREITDDTWTYYVDHRLIVVSEIYAGHSAAAYNAFKSIITDDKIKVKKKYLDPYETELYVHGIACSNSVRALRLDNKDRRWLVPKITTAKQPEEYWLTLHDWLDIGEGYRKIRHWAREFLKTNKPVSTAAEAPWTQAKRDMIEEQFSPGMVLINKYLEWIKRAYELKGILPVAETTHLASDGEALRVLAMAKAGRHFIMFDVHGVLAIKQANNRDRLNGPLETKHTVLKVAQHAEFYTGEERGQLQWQDAFKGRVISLSQELAAKPVAQLAKEEVPVINLAKLIGELEVL